MLKSQEVDDVGMSHAGGCGSMYEIVIDSEQFQGKRLLQQHRLVNEVGSGGIAT